MWLESFLKDYRGSLIVVSHERDLLNNVVDHILHLERGGLSLYRGNYDAFARQRGEREARPKRCARRQEAKAKKLQAYVDRWRYKAHTARQAQSRLKALAAMEPIAAAVEDASVVVRLSKSEGARPPLIVLDDVAVGYVARRRRSCRGSICASIPTTARPGRPQRQWQDDIGAAARGPIAAEAGAVAASRQIARRLFRAASDRGAGAPTRRRSSTWSACWPAATPGEVRAQLGRFGFSGDKANVAVRQLSGGERARLSLALITRDAPHILILDEPTNHLDIEAREALVEALSGFGGAVVMVSHDRHLLGLIADRLLLVDGGTAQEFDGSLDDYRAKVLACAQAQGANDRKSRQAGRPEARPESRRPSARASPGLAQAGRRKPRAN